MNLGELETLRRLATKDALPAPPPGSVMRPIRGPGTCRGWEDFEWVYPDGSVHPVVNPVDDLVEEYRERGGVKR